MRRLSLSPLFEKLLDENPEIPFEKVPKNLQSFEEFQESVIRDISRLLNTRVPTFFKNYMARNYLNPFNYGIDLNANIFTEDALDMRAVEIRIEKALIMFEPRLKNPKVQVLKADNAPESFLVSIDATVRIGERRVPVSFPVITVRNGV